MDLADNTVEIQPTIQEDQVERIELATKQVLLLTRRHQAAQRYVQDHTTKSLNLCKIVMKTMVCRRPSRLHSLRHSLEVKQN